MATKVNNPYSISSIIQDLWVKTRFKLKLGVNMYNFGIEYISGYNTITSIPTEYSPSTIMTNNASNWRRAFYGMSNLTSLPSTFYNMSNAVDCNNIFGQCRNVNDFSKTLNGTKINDISYAFYNCTNLTTPPTIPSSVTNMSRAFGYCTNLTTPPTIPNGVLNLSYAFYNCRSLTTCPTIPTSVNNMYYTFSNCRNLKKFISIPDCNIKYANGCFENCVNITGNLYIYAKNLQGTNSIVNTGNNSVRKYVFAYTNTNTWNSLTESSWGQFGSGRFNSYVNALLIDIENPSTNIQMEHYAKINIPNYNTLTTIPSGYLPANINSFTANCTNWQYAFEDGDKLTSLPSSWYNMSKAVNCYMMCQGITDVTNFGMIKLPSTCKNAREAFCACWNLKTPPNVSLLPSDCDVRYIFESCQNLTSVPNFGNVTNLDCVFYRCYNLKTVTSLRSVVTSMYRTFWYCSNLTCATIPANVVDLYGCFQECTSLTTMPTIPSKVTDMSYCFSNCIKLTSVKNIPASVTELRSCFEDCIALKSPPNILSSNVDMTSCFENCQSLTTMPTFPANVSYADSCFENCQSLTTMKNIPANVRYIRYMFRNCKNLKGDIYIFATNYSWAEVMDFMYNSTTYVKNIYVKAGSNTYNVFYEEMGNATYNANWNAYLKTF